MYKSTTPLTKVCLSCSQHCATCSENTGVCTQCVNHYKINTSQPRDCLRIPDSKLIIIYIQFEAKNKLLRIKFQDKFIRKNWNKILWIEIDSKKGRVKQNTSRVLENNTEGFEYTFKQSQDNKELLVHFDNLPNMKDSTIAIFNTSLNNINVDLSTPGSQLSNSQAIKSYPNDTIVKPNVNYYNPENSGESIFNSISGSNA